MDAFATIYVMDIRHKKTNKEVKFSVQIDLFFQCDQCYNVTKIGRYAA